MVTTKTIDALPITTPSIVRIARILLARRACMASFHVSPQNADVLRAMAIQINARIQLPRNWAAAKEGSKKKGRFIVKTFQVAGAAIVHLCFLVPAGAPPDTV